MSRALVLDGPWNLMDVVLRFAKAAGLELRRHAGLRHWCAELRIDVDLPADDLEGELAQLYARWFMSGAALADIEGIGPSRHGLVFKTRHADGEHFIYVVDPVRRVLAAYIVLSRLVEVNRCADKHLRSPHAKVAQAYRRSGITSQVYRWWLDGGRNLMTGERQSPHAHGMWLSLARHYELAYVCLQDKRVLKVESEAPETVLDNLGTRMVLLGRGCAVSQFATT